MTTRAARLLLAVAALAAWTAAPAAATAAGPPPPVAAAMRAAASAGTNAADAGDDLISTAAPEALLGERFFFDSRFSQFFFAHAGGDPNATLAEGDPVVDEIASAVGPPLPGPFRGRAMNCRQCHLGDDFLPGRPLAGRTYCDFDRRSPIPARADGQTRTPRNSPPTIDIDAPRDVPKLFHFDGEFATVEDLVIDTMTGRNFGWLPEEAAIAAAHAARVVREDAGVQPRRVTHPGGRGVPYGAALLGTAPDLPPHLRIPPRYRLDVKAASDDATLFAAARLVNAYMHSLRFGVENTGRDAGSPYDQFLERNDLPPEPAPGESALAYARRLRTLVRTRPDLAWITPADGTFVLHDQPWKFGAAERDGLLLFIGEDGPGSAGNCVACHPPPRFTDHRLHNNGVAQVEYDAVFGAGAFAALAVPDLATRNARFDDWLPPSPRHPKATGRFRAAAAADRPGYADLGAWNVVGNPDMPKPQTALLGMLCRQFALAAGACTAEAVLPRSIGFFKTPTVRDLGQSNPYFHTGALDTIEDVVRFYVRTSALARDGKVRNASRELGRIRLEAEDVAPLAAFLRALNEDYQ